MTYDVIIRGGTVVDGKGSRPRVAVVAVQDGIIVGVRRINGSSRRTIDADGLTVTPGFVDNRPGGLVRGTRATPR